MTKQIIKKTRLLKLRFTELVDLDYILHLESRSENAQFIVPWTKEQHESALNKSDIKHLIIENNKNERVGFIIVAGIGSSNDTIEFLRIIIAEKGKGYGQEAIKLLQEWVFDDLMAHRLWLDVKEYNTKARKLYSKVGFTEEGILRECLKSEGKYESLVIMSILRHEFSKFREGRDTT